MLVYRCWFHRRHHRTSPPPVGTVRVTHLTPKVSSVRRVFIPPPIPPVVPGPRPGVNPYTPRAKAAVFVRPPSPVRADPQNVHDTVFVRHLSTAYNRLPEATVTPAEALSWARRVIPEHTAALDAIASNPIPLSALSVTEAQVLARVVSRILSETDPDKRKDLESSLRWQLQDIATAPTCASGRVARVLDTLSGLDDAVTLRPTWALRRELLDRASVLSSAQPHLEGEELRRALRDAFLKEYVSTGLCTQAWLDGELSSWGDLS